MAQRPTERACRRQPVAAVGALACVAFCWSAACRSPGQSGEPPAAATLRVGVSIGEMATADPQNGVRQVAQNLSLEGLVKIGDDGRPSPWLAQSWEFAPDGRTLK